MFKIHQASFLKLIVLIFLIFIFIFFNKELISIYNIFFPPPYNTNKTNMKTDQIHLHTSLIELGIEKKKKLHFALVAREASEKENRKRPLIVFVHGSPGDWKANLLYLQDKELVHYADLLAIDRLGYGNSENSESFTSLKKQSQAIFEVLKPFLRKRKIVLVGHSLGGSIICKMAMDYINLFSGLVVVAGALDPKFEELKWYNKLIDINFIKWFIPKNFITSNEEMKALKKELEDMLQSWNKLNSIKITLIQGMRDNLVSPENVSFLKNKLTTKNLRVVEDKKEGHFIYWKKPELIKKEILNHLL